MNPVNRAVQDPFAALGLEPTLDPLQVKRAYFAALQRHPPHADPEGFRRIRDAYEALSAPAALEQAYSRHPVDLDAELRKWEDQLGAAIEAAARAREEDLRSSQTLRRFVEELSGQSLEQVVASFGP